MPIVLYGTLATVMVASLVFYLFYSGGNLREKRVVNQKHTMIVLRDCAEALRAYREVHGGFPAAPWSVVVLHLAGSYPTRDLPVVDVYGTPLSYSTSAPDERGLADHFELRSASADRKFEGSTPGGPFDTDDFDRDIVVSDTAFVQWPQRGATAVEPAR